MAEHELYGSDWRKEMMRMTKEYLISLLRDAWRRKDCECLVADAVGREVKILIYDCEIIKAIRNKKEESLQGIEYCRGWHDFDNMGISVICAYDYVEGRFRVFCKDNFSDFQALVDARDIIVGFNSIGFDNPLCAAGGIRVPDEKSYDILVEIWKGAGLGPEFAYPSHAGYGLDAVCKVNFKGMGKSGHGALAPVQWQRGETGAVIDYCTQDVTMTKRLLDQIITAGAIVDPKGGGELRVRRPMPSVDCR